MAPPSVTWEKLTLQLRNPFGLSYGVSETRDAFWIRLIADEGWGEGTIPRYYGIDAAEMTAYWDTVGRRRKPFPDEIGDIEAWLGTGGPQPARCALELALHDRIGRQRNEPLHVLLQLPKPAFLRTSYTIGLDTPEDMARLATEAASYPTLKIKLGTENDVPRFEAVRRARPDATLLVDANSGWTRENAVANIRAMEDLGLTLVEQPVDKDDIEGLGVVQRRVGVPVVADESLQSRADVDRLASSGVRGVNVKLMKLGGIGPSLAVIRRARELGLGVMLGCMVETSLGVTAMAHLAGYADWLDLDSPILISNDPFEGLAYDETGQIHLPARPGIGVQLAPDTNANRRSRQ